MSGYLSLELIELQTFFPEIQKLAGTQVPGNHFRDTGVSAIGNWRISTGQLFLDKKMGATGTHLFNATSYYTLEA
jgi:hypothetical protein